VLAGLHDRDHQLGKSAPTAFRILRDRRMAAGIEQHVTLNMPQQRARNRKLDGLATLGRREENVLAHAQPAAGQKMHIHGSRLKPAPSTFPSSWP
jgi:hypothetical protein